MTNKTLEAALKLLDETDWYLFQLQASGFPRELCGSDCEQHRDDGMDAMEDCSCLFCHGAYAATRDPHRLKVMWDTYPHGLLALRTGLISGVFVVDADRHAGGADGIENLRALKNRVKGSFPRTCTALTGGGGRHLFYRHPGPDYVIRSQNTLGPGIDVKGENQYVILPPSKKSTASAGYDWEDMYEPWNMQIAVIDPKIGNSLVTKPDPNAGRVIDVHDPDFEKMANDAVKDALDRLRHAIKGERNSRLFYAACRVGEAVYGGALSHQDGVALLMGEAQHHFNNHEANKTIRSGIRTGMADAKRGLVRDVR